MDEQDVLLAAAAPDFGVEARHRIQRQVEAVFLALGQAGAVPGKVLGLVALVQGFKIEDGHGRLAQKNVMQSVAKHLYRESN